MPPEIIKKDTEAILRALKKNEMKHDEAEIYEENLINEISDISTKIMYLEKNDEKVQLLVQLNLLLKQNEQLIKAKYPDILASILDSL